MAAALSFEQAPPITVPFRFFATAPLFGVAAGLLFAFQGETIVASRWAGPTLALTHLVTLGFMLMAMCGAMLQFMPVAAGANVWRPRLVASVTHAGLIAGTLLLAAGFLGAGAALFQAAAVVLGFALAAFIVVVAIGLAASPAIGPTIVALRLAVLGLAVTVALGLALAAAFGWGLALPLVDFVSAHVAWGLIGWSLLLLAAVAYLVVPMFQLTPPYPLRFARALPWWLSVAVACWSLLAVGAGAPAAAWWALGAAVAGALAFAGMTLHLQRRRKRKQADATLLFWRCAMLCVPVAAAALLAVALLPEGVARERITWLAGVLALYGVFVAAINGMLYKIVPFLSWLHLQRVLMMPPNMHQMLGDKAMKRQFRAHLGALAALCLCAAEPRLAPAAGLLVAASSGWLLYNLSVVMGLYARLNRHARAAMAKDASTGAGA